eukprot:CAMPEP_0178942850 /NCGR_PEP_ID=MMETSP0789-20121207/2237_1 /TAXON_ID=3005 /ORGANISM="Rhizosolenia setigera, Strain CCMP 1694" /LENGTH=288 /DNA_ID=CAMNT_0020622333 /DNA_START=325 /DNA_END=1191 /DNA_ORIENTATION=-
MKFYDRFFALSATVCFTEAFTPNTPFDLQRRTNAALKASLSYDPNAAGAKPSVASSPATSSSSGASEKWDNALKVQGGSLKTWTYASPAVDRLEVSLKTDGRPLDADIDLWQGPDNTPTKMRVYVEDGALRPFSAVIETPRGPNTVAIRNIGHLEFPISAVVVANDVESSAADLAEAPKRTVQGGALQTYPFDPSVEAVQILLQTDGRPLNARIELLQGPNNNKQVMEVYSEDGSERPFFAIVETPGSGNVIRCQNTAPVEFPMYASVGAYRIGSPENILEPILGGDP